MKSLAVFAALALALPARADEAALKKLVDDTVPRVAKVMGLPAPPALKVLVLTRAAAEARLKAGLARDYPGDSWRRLGEALIAVGLAPPGTDLPTLAPKFYSEQASGFFDLTDHTLCLIDDQSTERQTLVIAHELAHAFQDSQLDLNAESKSRESNEDASLALSAALEGQAQLTASLVMDLTLKEKGIHVVGMPELIGNTSAGSAEELAKDAPTAWLGLQLGFPYGAGSLYIAGRKTNDDPVARAVLKELPTSTAQILDPHFKPTPRPKLNLAAHIPGSKSPWSNALGRAGVALLGSLRGDKLLGAGVQTDRIESVQLAGKPVVVWAIAFEKPEQAARFAEVLKPLDVQTKGSTAVLLSGVPIKSRAAILKAAF